MVTGTAISGTDYAAISESLAFAANETTVDVPVMVIDDEIVEGDETVTASVLAGPNNVVGSPAASTVMIADNDGPKVEIVSATGVLKVAKWEDQFQVNAAKTALVVIGPTAGTNLDFIDRDPDRFNVWVLDKTAWNNTTAHIEAKISTTNEPGFTEYNDNATAVDLVRFTGPQRGSGWYWSDSQILVSNDADDKFSSATYLGADEAAPGVRGLRARTQKGVMPKAIDGTVGRSSNA